MQCDGGAGGLAEVEEEEEEEKEEEKEEKEEEKEEEKGNEAIRGCFALTVEGN